MMGTWIRLKNSMKHFDLTTKMWTSVKISIKGIFFLRKAFYIFSCFYMCAHTHKSQYENTLKFVYKIKNKIKVKLTKASCWEQNTELAFYWWLNLFFFLSLQFRVFQKTFSSITILFLFNITWFKSQIKVNITWGR